MNLKVKEIPVRTIRKRNVPPSLTEWRAPRMANIRPEGMECTYNEMRRWPGVLDDIENNLLAEQGGICAYTGLRIGIRASGEGPEAERYIDFHIEHLRPQVHCSYGQDADYRNMVACWPKPNCGFEPAYGARKKGNWPSAEHEAIFISPLRHDCSVRFVFNHKGGIAPAIRTDQAAIETISRLGLSNDKLTELRKEAIWGAFNLGGRNIRLAEARRLRSELDNDSQALDNGANIQLRAFCFVIRHALEREIHKLEGIMGQR